MPEYDFPVPQQTLRDSVEFILSGLLDSDNPDTLQNITRQLANSDVLRGHRLRNRVAVMAVPEAIKAFVEIKQMEAIL